MKLRLTLWLLLTAAIGVLNAQTTVTKVVTETTITTQDTLATRQWVRDFLLNNKVPTTTTTPTTPTTPITNKGAIKFIINGTGNSIDFNDPDGISPSMKRRFRAFVQGENGVDAVRLVFNWGDYNPTGGIYRNDGIARAIAWIKSLRPNDPPKVRLLFVPILGGNDPRIPKGEIQVDNNGNEMDCTYNSLFTTVPSYYSPTATALLDKCYDVLFPFLAQNFGNDIEVVELGAGQSEEHYMPYTSGGTCGTYSGIGDYSEAAKTAFRKQYGADLPNVGVTVGHNYNMNYAELSYRNAAQFWGSGISGIWERFRVKAKQHTKFKVGAFVPDLLNDQGCKWIFHGFAIKDMIDKCDVFYHTYNHSPDFWYANLLGIDLLEGTRPNQIEGEIEYDTHDLGPGNDVSPINEQHFENSVVKFAEHGGRGVHFALDWGDGQIEQVKRVIGKVRTKNPQPISRETTLTTHVPTIEVRMSEIFNSSYFLDNAWRRAGNNPNDPYNAKPVNLKLIGYESTH